MWSSLLLLAVLGMLNPVRLGVTALVISRPRPLPNLLAYWTGSLTVGVPVLFVPLLVLQFTPMLRSFSQDWADPGASSTVQRIQVGFGVFALSVAVLLTLSLVMRRRPAGVAAQGSPAVLDEPDTASAQSSPLNRAEDDAAEGGSAIRRLIGRANNAWENGSLWVTWLIGLLVGPGPDAVLFALAIIVASGAALGAQLVAAAAYLVAMLAVVEVILVSYLVTPAKTRAALKLLHDWASAHRRHILIAIFAVLGFSMVAHGMGGI